jgi:pimeloyl-ACP methyl ester carboxylesterase
MTLLMIVTVSCVRRFSLWGLVVAGVGCAPTPELLLEADAARVAAVGEDGPAGALLVQRQVRVRGDRVIDVDVVLAADADGHALPAQTPVLFVHGGAAPAARYFWIARHLASRGHAVVLPHFLFDLALFAEENAEGGLAAVRVLAAGDDADLGGTIANEGAVVMGHSLGAVVAAGAFERDSGLERLVMLSGYPDPGTTPTRSDGFVLSVTGAQDGLVDIAEVADGVDAMRAPAIGAVVAGLTHYQLTDNPTAGELAREGSEGDDLETVRRRALFLMDAAVEDPLLARDPSRWPDGVTTIVENP